MKTRIANFYSRLRNSLDTQMTNLLRQQNIIRFGDHFLYTPLLTENATVIDLGANDGRFSRKLYDTFKCRIVLVEPNNDLLQRIQVPNSIKVNSAVTSSDVSMTFYMSSNSEASSLDKDLAAQYGIIEERTIECISFQTLLARNKIASVSLLKIDIEGAEIGLIGSMTDENLELCDQLAIEFHDFMMPLILRDVKVTASRLRGLGFIQLKLSPTDWRRVLFVRNDKIKLDSSFWTKFHRLSGRSFILDFVYYKLLLRLHRII